MKGQVCYCSVFKIGERGKQATEYYSITDDQEKIYTVLPQQRIFFKNPRIEMQGGSLILLTIC